MCWYDNIELMARIIYFPGNNKEMYAEYIEYSF